jgi:rare lipoprotein A
MTSRAQKLPRSVTMARLGGVLCVLAATALGACATVPPREATAPPREATAPPREATVPPVPEMVAPPRAPRVIATGKASWYGEPHHGRKTANGEVFDMNALTAAHPTLPLGTHLLVTNLANGRSVEVRVNDRGPVAPDRVIDLSYAAARALGVVADGVFRVRIAVVE